MSIYHRNNMYGQHYDPNARMQQPVPAPCRSGDPLSDMAIAMAYVPWQQWRQIMEPAKGLQHGTIFRELDKPYTGKRGMRS